MKRFSGKNKFVALLLALAVMLAQFVIVPGVVASATSYSALTGRSDFKFGVNIRGNNLGLVRYDNTYQAVIDAKSLGSDIVRVKDDNSTSYDIAYFSGLADIITQKGMEVMLQQTSIHRWVLKRSGDDKIPCTLSEVKSNKSAIIDYYTDIATAYKGKVAYYQIGNEMDADSKSSTYYQASDANSGRTASQFVDISGIALGIYYAKQAIKAVDPSAKIIVNTSWKDSGFIKKLKSYYYDTANDTIVTSSGANRVQLSWDYTGLDFYAKSGLEGDYSGVISDLTALSEPVIITEAGLSPTVNNGTVTFTGDADWYADFITEMYGNNKVKGVISFELYDAYTAGTADKANSYHGLIDYQGNKRTEFGVLQTLFGGSNITRATVGAVDSASERAGDIVENLDASVKEVTMGKIFSSGSVSNIFFSDTLSSASTTTYSSSSIFEFDMYVEDAAAFRSALETSNDRKLFVMLSGTNSSRRYALDISVNNIEKDGWNHFVLVRTHLSTTNGFAELEGEHITGINIGYYGDNDYTNPASGLKLAFANFCFTSIGANQKTLTPTTEARSSFPAKYTAKRFSTKYSQLHDDTNAVYATNVGKYYLEFDVYVDNYTNFLNSLKKDGSGNDINYGLAFVLSQSGNALRSAATDGAKQKFDITDSISHSGWNHIILYNVAKNTSNIYPLAPYDSDSGLQSEAKHSYCLAYLDYDNGKSLVTSGDTLNSASADFFAMTYVSFFGARGIPDIDLTGKQLWTSGHSDYPDGQFKNKTYDANDTSNGVQVGFCRGATWKSEMSNGTQIKNFKQEVNGVECDHIEFDFFVINAPYLMKVLASDTLTDHSICFKLRDDQGRTAQYDITDQITTTGWNHIVMPRPVTSLGWTYNNGSFTTGQVFSKAWVVLANTENNPPVANDKSFSFIVANLITTKDVLVPEAPAKLASSYVSLGTDETLDFDFTTDFLAGEDFTSSPKNISSNNIFEFDFYSDASYASGNADDITFMVSDSNGNYKSYNITKFISAAGWNHVFLRIDRADDSDGAFDATSVVSWYVVDTYQANGDASNVDNLSGYVANVYAAVNALGDVNRNGSSDIVDLICAKKMVAGVAGYALDYTADLTFDANIDALDITAIVNRLIGKVS